MAGHVSAYPIRKAGVLGAGNMGSRIAAHFANIQIPVVLLDIDKKLVQQALEGLKKAKPAAFFDPDAAKLIQLGSFDADLSMLSDCDWIVEAVAENLDIKRGLIERVSKVRRANAIVTTNTSGLPVSQIAETMDAAFKTHWFGAHFFNPPRYMRLLEIIPTPDTDPAAVEAVSQFASQRLGKTVVAANDTPNFIANRIGTFAMLNAVRVMQELDLTIEEVDALTGAALGWPKMGTFRLTDMVGVDVLVAVAKNFFQRVQDERPDVAPPAFLEEMVSRGWLGDKKGQGFYKKTGNGEERLGLDWKTLEYRPSARANFPLLEISKNAGGVAERLKMLLSADPAKDRAAAFYWQVLPGLWNYAANRILEVAPDIVSIDNAMKAGFNWELGPFEMWDAAGVTATSSKFEVASAARQLIEGGHSSWYVDHPATPSGRSFFDVKSGDYQPEPAPAGTASVAVIKKSHGVVKKNAGASLVDLGDGVACIEFHSKMNSIGGDIVSLLIQTLSPDSSAVKDFEAFVITNDAEHFSAGANLMQLLLASQEGEWDEVESAIRSFQRMTQAIKFCSRPVVAAPFGMCLGGGAEVSLHAAARQAHAELYVGLVETGVGLIPAGGGCKEMAMRGPETLKSAFENIAMAKVSTSAADAVKLGYLLPGDQITMNRRRLLLDAKARAQALAAAGYSAPIPRRDIPAAGESVLATLRMGVRLMREGEFISDHDVKVANAVAHILCGGEITPGTLVSEQYFLELELEAFLRLCGEKKTQERIAYTLKTGKPLRN